MTPLVRPPGAMWSPPPFRAPALGQIPSLFRVVVTDVRGTPFSGVTVEISPPGLGLGVETTGSSGTVSFAVPGASEVAVTLRVGDFVTRRRARTDETLFVEIPICAPPALLMGTEIVALLAGAALAGAGFYWKVDALQVMGEVIFGAATFTAIYRHSCNW